MKMREETRLIVSVPRSYCINVQITDTKGLSGSEETWMQEQVNCASSKIRKDIEANARHKPLGKGVAFIYFSPPSELKYARVEYSKI